MPLHLNSRVNCLFYSHTIQHLKEELQQECEDMKRLLRSCFI